MCDPVGSYDAIVDAAHFDFVPGIGAVLLEDDMIERTVEFPELIKE